MAAHDRRLAVLLEEERMEIEARHRRDYEIADARYRESLSIFASRRRHLLALVGMAVISGAQPRK